MRKQVMSVVVSALLSTTLLSTPVLADAPQVEGPVASDAQPDATVQLSEGSVAAGIGYTWGHGRLTIDDKSHKFSISGVSIGDVGVADVTAKGNVYNLRKLSDFAGNYTAVTAGVTVAGGVSATYLKNEHGVIIKLVSTNVGLSFNLSVDGVHVKLVS